jgi:adenine-specific DNA-methyltransferase
VRANAQLALRAEGWTSPPAKRDVQALGAIYTPPYLARWVAHELNRVMSSGARGSVWDIACGDGALLLAVNEIRGQGTHLAGADIDENAVHLAQAALPHARVVCLDALAAHGFSDPVNALIDEFGGRPDAIILNPPWGAEVSHSAETLRRTGFELARGQFDSYALFVELALALLPAGGAAALILPDSLFNSEQSPLRRLLLETATLDLVARLGEGFFPSIYRGTAVIVLRKSTPAQSHQVRCLRLRPSVRRLVISQQCRLEDVCLTEGHDVSQTRFLRSPQLHLAIDVKENESGRLDQMEETNPMVWREWCHSGRGVELSKRGDVLMCPTCMFAVPVPRTDKQLRCRSCRISFSPEAGIRERIVMSAKDSVGANGDWRPLIAGEDVRRYESSASRSIRMGVPGINYKDSQTYSGRRLLVRKTGLGLMAAVDCSEALTNQVVYHFTARDAETDDFLVDYLAGVLNSRFMFAYYLKTRGESEWRSHPYITQRILTELPVPAPIAGTWWARQARAIATAARERGKHRQPSPSAELEIEALVAGLYGFVASDWRWTLGVLQDAQSLQAIREVRLDPAISLTPVRLA